MAKQQHPINVPEGSEPREISIGPNFKVRYGKGYSPKGTYGDKSDESKIIWVDKSEKTDAD
uniref:Uncharacterized protein n=1 Tax=viral metagenome TaxID=1070528 RepID=A0A6M3JLK5_9ZZZZ